MKQNFFRKDWIQELEKVKNLISEQCSEIDVRNLAVLIGRLGTYHYKKKGRMLLGIERKLYDLLIENSYNPFTVYRWLLLERIPEDIKFQLRNNYLNQKKAIKLSFQRKHKTKGSLCTEIKNLGMQLLQGW